MKLVKNFMLYKLILLTLIGVVPLTQSSVVAQERRNSSAKSFASSFEPPNRDAPSATSGGASRGQQCIVDLENSKVPITPILPAIDQRLTVASHPTFFIHIPQTSAKQVFLQIEDENEENAYQTVIPISGDAGILRVTLPQEAPSLEVGKSYNWALALMCANTLQPDSPIVQGSITRVSNETELSAMTPIEQANFYAESGIWYEAIATLANLKQEQPDNANLLAIWDEVLSSVGLNEIAKAEFVQ